MFLNRYSDNVLSLILFISASVWGLFWIPLRGLEEAGLTGTWSVIMFNACGLFILVPLIIWNRKTQLHSLLPTLAIAMFVGLGFSLYSVSFLITDVVRATILFYLTSIWSSIIGWIWLSERMSIARIFAIGLGLLGLFFLVSGAGDASRPFGIGDLFGFLSGVSWAIGAACMKRWPDTPVLTQTAGCLVFTCLFSFLIGLMLFGATYPAMEDLLSTLPLTFAASWILLIPSMVLMLSIAKRLYPGRVGILMMSEVFVAIFSATLLLPEEVMTLVQWFGGGLIILACLCEVFVSTQET